jgi:AraC-like DNA-binding protein
MNNIEAAPPPAFRHNADHVHVLAIDLEAGYGSHQALTRAFRDQFGLTPPRRFARGNLDDIEIAEAVNMDETLLANVEPRHHIRQRLDDLVASEPASHTDR